MAEAFSRRQERLNEAELARLRESGQIAERGISRMGDVISSGMNNAYQEYKQGRQRGRDESFDKVKYDRLRVEDEYWNGPWDGGSGGSGGVRGLNNGPGAIGVGSAPEGVPQGGQGTGSATISQRAEDDVPTRRQLKPAQSFSPGAVAVLEGRAKPGFNPAVKEYGNPTLDYVGGKIGTAQYLGLPRTVATMPNPGPRGSSNNVPPTNSAPGAAPFRIGLGSGFGVAAEDDFRRPAGDKTRIQHKWDLGLMKSEEELRQLRRGKNPNARANAWQDTKRVDAAGHPIMFNAQTGEYAVDKNIKVPPPKNPGAMTEYQAGQLELGKQRLAQAKSSGKGGLTPYQQYQMGRNQVLDAQRGEERRDAADAKAKDKLDTRVTKYSANMEPTVKALGQLEIIHGIMDKSEDVPGFGQTAAVPDLFVSREGQDLRQAVKTLFNIELKDRSGAAVVDQELNRLKEEFGQGNWKTDRQLREGIRSYERRLHEVIRNNNAGFDADVINEYTGRGGRDSRTFAPTSEEKWVKGKRYIRGKNPQTGEEGWVPAK